MIWHVIKSISYISQQRYRQWSAELLEELSCGSGRDTGISHLGSGSGAIEEWQLVSMVGKFPDKEVVSPVDTVDNSRVSASIESETCAA